MTALDSSCTLRVENIPLQTEDASLEDLFCDYGPIKRCFVVKPKKPGAKKTIGYVQFTTVEDTVGALEATSGKGLQLNDADLKIKMVPDRGGGVKQEESEDKVHHSEEEERRKFARQKKARLIVRNLSFKATEASLKKHLEEEGGQRKAIEVKILRKPDGKMVGCGFVQFSNVSEAADAIKQLNGKSYLGRPIAVDWAVAKKEYDKSTEESKVDVKDEPHEGDATDDEIKEEDEEEEQADEHEDESDDDENTEGPNNERRWETGHDVGENCTVFVRNLSFETEEDALKALMEDNFGKVVFAAIVMNKETNRPKGTAFVKFSNADSASKCAQASQGLEGIFLDERRIYCLPAITKDRADDVGKQKKERRSKDSRNLYLAREGLVREGTLAAEGVSKEDMAKRNQLIRWKKGVLKDLNMFVSPVRLCLRNFPLHINDKGLRALIKKHVDDPKAKVTECKVMRDFKTVDKTGQAASKGYGFVTFTEHEAALAALRKLNNNPSVFRNDCRPIVEFSIENRKALQARQRRLEKSIEKNPLANKGKKPSIAQHRKPDKREVLEDKDAFVGSTNNPKVKGLPSHEGPKLRRDRPRKAISRKELKKKQKNPTKRKRLETIAEQGNQDEGDSPAPAKKAKKSRRRIGSKATMADLKEDKKFNAMVDSYKRKLMETSVVPVKSKWFES